MGVNRGGAVGLSEQPAAADMRLTAVAFLLFTCVWLTAGDVAHLKSKAKLLGRLAAKAKHHKRGIFSPVPPFKLGHDIPLVTHSVVKPLVVTYPPTAAVTAVKVPLTNPLLSRYPVPVGHPVPVSHSHYGPKFPHQVKSVVIQKPDHHYHHHHHHIAPKPGVPIVPGPPPIPLIPAPAPVPATPIIPVGSPTVSVSNPIPAPPPPVFVQPNPVITGPAPVAPVPPFPLAPAPPLPVAPPPINIFPPQHIFKPVLPAPPPIPLAPLVRPPIFPYAPQFSYVLRPGNAVQTSFFATYPRLPLINYQTPLVPFPASENSAHLNHVFYERPQINPYQVVPQVALSGEALEQPTPNVAVQPNPTFLQPAQTEIPQPIVHLQPTQTSIPIDHDGWSPVAPQSQDISPVHHPESNQFGQPNEGQQYFTQEQGTQVFEQHIGSQDQFHDYQNQLHHHIQQQIEQSQYDQHNNNDNQPRPEYGIPQVDQQHPGQAYSQHNQDYPQNTQEYHHNIQEYTQQVQDYAQQAQEYAQHAQHYAQHNQIYSQANQIGLQQQQPNEEYGIPQQVDLGHSQGLEGRNAEEEGDTQRYHNHIPLGLQPPIDRPLENFR